MTGFVRFRVTAVQDGGAFQTLSGEGEGGERLDKLLRIQPDGFSTAPKAGSLGLAMFDGSRTRGVVIGMESEADRPRNTPDGGKVIYGPNGQVLKAFGGDWKLDTPNGVFEGKGQSATLTTPDGATVSVLASGDIAVKPKPGGTVFLGGAPGDGTFAFVQTVSGPASNVKALV